MPTALAREQLLDFLSQELALDVSVVTDTTPLVSSGLVSSLSLVSLILFVESRCGIRLAANDVTLDNLDTIERVLAFTGRSA